MGDSLLSPKIQRARTKPNLQVTEDQYQDALHALLLADPPLLDMKSKLGPVFCKHVKQVTPGHLVSLEKFWYPIIHHGCKQLVLQSNKIKAALHKFVLHNNVLIPHGTLPVLIPVIIDDVKQHIMDCAAMMRALKNDGMSGARCYGLASGLKNKMVGVHMQVLGPILQHMEFSDTVMMEPGMPCPLSPPIDIASIPMLQPSNVDVLGGCTPTKLQRFATVSTPEKLMQEMFVDDVQVGDNIMGEGKGVPTRSMEHEHVQRATDDGDVQTGDVPDAIDAEGVPKVSGDCPLDPEVAVDENGYPTIVGDIIKGKGAMQDDDNLPSMAEAMQDDDSLPSMAEGNEAMHDDDSVLSIKPINPNVRSRKLEVNAAAKALLEDELANGVARTVRKRLRSKQPTKKTKSLKAKMIQQWHQSEEDPQGADASNEPHQKRVQRS